MNRFAEWMNANDKKQRGVAKKLGVAASTIHDIMRKGQMPSLKLAYKIEQYTKGAITVYDWVDDDVQEKNSDIANPTAKPAAKKISE